MKLEDLQPNAAVRGILPDALVTVVGVQWFGSEALELTYKTPAGKVALLLIVNRLVDSRSVEWAQWILLLALGGFAGNFVFSLTDHAMNGFFYRAEWIPVISSAFAVSFLVVTFLVDVGPPFLMLCGLVLVLQAVVGIAGFLLHALADLRQPAPGLFEKIIAGAPPLAPLLFPNLVLLGLIGLRAFSKHLPRDS